MGNRISLEKRGAHLTPVSKVNPQQRRSYAACPRGPFVSAPIRPWAHGGLETRDNSRYFLGFGSCVQPMISRIGLPEKKLATRESLMGRGGARDLSVGEVVRIRVSRAWNHETPFPVRSPADPKQHNLRETSVAKHCCC